MKLIATNISNLTDARFFAAYMPELLVMPEVHGENLSEMMTWFDQVRPWIEGPSWAIAISENTTPGDLQIIADHGIDTVVYEGTVQGFLRPSEMKIYLKGSIQDVNEWQTFSEPMEGLILLDYQIGQTIPAHIPAEIYLHLSAQADHIVDAANHHKITGIAVEGGAEEKVGLKSYEQIIDLLDTIL